MESKIPATVTMTSSTLSRLLVTREPMLPFTRWYVPIVLGIAYVAMVIHFYPRDDEKSGTVKKRQPDSPLRKAIIIAHNVFLCVFSAITFLGTYKLFTNRCTMNGNSISVFGEEVCAFCNV